MITNKKLVDFDLLLKKNLKKALHQKKIDLALRLIELSANLQYNYGFNESLYDKVLEDSLKHISDSHFENRIIEPVKDVVLFYDFFGYDNRGLTQQYLRALQDLNKRIVLVFENKTRYYQNTDILAEIENYENKVIYYLEGEDRIAKSQNLLDIISNEKPESILMHLIPWDTIAYLAFYKTKGSTRYQINLTDHTFWLGVDITDINIEFRSYGLNLSEQLRNIPRHKNKILPYYPIFSKTEFQGFNFQTNGKKIIFSGSAFYKIFGNDFEFFKTIQNLLAVDENLIFVLAGSGNRTAVEQFITKNHLEDKFFLIGDRTDLSEVMQRVDYYISTFPFTGALMTQIAIAANIPVLAYVHPKSLFNDLKDLMYKFDNYKNIEDLTQFVEKFSDLHYKKSSKNFNDEIMITKEEFAINLQHIFEGKNPMDFIEKRQNVTNSMKTFNELMLESENLSNTQFEVTINNYLSHWEKFKIIPEYRKNYNKKLLKKDKILFLKTLYYIIRKKI